MLRWSVVAVVALVLIAGCSASPGPGAAPEGPATEGPDTAGTSGAQPAATDDGATDGGATDGGTVTDGGAEGPDSVETASGRVDANPETIDETIAAATATATAPTTATDPSSPTPADGGATGDGATDGGATDGGTATDGGSNGPAATPNPTDAPETPAATPSPAPTDTPTPDTPTPTTPEPTATPSPTATPTATPEPTPSPTPEPPDNPWRQRTVVVGLNNEANPSRNVRSLLADALDYWEGGAAAQYGDYTVDFELRPDARNPDVQVNFVETVRSCGSENAEYTVGCAPVIEDPGDVPANGPAMVDVASGYTEDSTRRALTHEFGHILGIRHGEAPSPLMDAATDAERIPRTDASDREFAWKPTDTWIATDGTSESEISEAIAYYDSDADGAVPDDRSFTHSEGYAEVTVRIAETEGCEGVSNSCAERQTENVDDDPAPEYYTGLTITVDPEVPSDEIDDHVGYWLAYGLGLDEQPPKYRTVGS